MNANFQTADSILPEWQAGVLSGDAPPRWRLGSEVFDSVEIGPGLVMLLGGAPGAGKTALAMQWVFDALAEDESLKVLVANVETTPPVLLDRQLARFSGVPLAAVRSRSFTEESRERLRHGFDQIRAVADRLAFTSPPFDLASIANAADETETNLLVLDYIQRIDCGEHRDSRLAMNALMAHLRRFVDEGVGVIALSAIGRSRDARGRISYDAEGLSLASFRESSELEFGCDSAYVLTRSKLPVEATLRCFKNRHGEPADLTLAFDGSLQRFEAVNELGSLDYASVQALTKGERP